MSVRRAESSGATGESGQSACPGCGLRVSVGLSFCPACGSMLAAPAAPAAPREERKVVTTLFCDLVSFTAASETADPEDVDAMLRRYEAVARAVIESYGGAVEKFIGDAVVGVFGVPAAHEDDAERAVHAGLRLLEALADVPAVDGAPLRARCGVNTGEALVRLDVDPASGEGFVAGDAVNTAARLQAAAPPMAVFVGALTHELTRYVVAYESLPPVDAKGKAAPVCAWRALRPLARTGLRTSGFATTAFIGREEEVGVLRSALEDAGDRREGHAVLVIGEPGMGKSRLVLEFARSLDGHPELVTWRLGRCLPYGDAVGFSALGDIVKEHAGIEDSDDVATVEAKLATVVPEGEEGMWIAQRLRPLLGLEASQAAREENFAAWTRFIELLATPRPTVLVVEDLHWAGEGMLAFIEHLVSRDVRAPLVLIATARPELSGGEVARLVASLGDGVRRVVLEPLPDADVSTLVRRLVADKRRSRLASTIVARAGGNPLFAEQYARLLLDDQTAGSRAEGAAVVRTGPRSPSTLEAVLAARLDALPAAHKALLCDAAVFGETFWRGGVEALSGSAAQLVGEAMAALAAGGLVRPVVTPSMEGEPEYVFWHALTRDVAYGLLPRRSRALKHRAAAGWFAVAAGGRGDELAEIVAYHYVTALELARSARDAELVTSLVGHAVAALERAGERALRLDAAAAERHFAAALELAGEDRAARLRILPNHGKALLLRNRYREALAAYREAVEGLRTTDDIKARGVALCWLGNVLLGLNEPAAGVMQEAVDLLEAGGPSPELVEVLGHYSLGLLIQDHDPRAVLAATDRALEVSRQLALPEPSVALSCRGGARLALGDSGGLDDFERAVELTRAQGAGFERATVEMNRSLQVFSVRGAVAERGALQEVYGFVSRSGIEAHVFSCRAALVDNLVKTGVWEDARLGAQRLVSDLEEAADVWDLLYTHAMQALLCARTGTPAEAASDLGWMEREARRSEIGWARDYALVAAAAVHLSAARRPEALDLLQTCFGAPRACGSVLEIAPEAVRTAVGAGDPGLAARIARQVEDLVPVPRLPLQERVVADLRAQDAETRGEHRAAAAGFADAAAGWRGFGMPYEEAHALLGRGRCLRQLGVRGEARAALISAQEIFARLGARPALTVATGLLQPLTSPG